MNVKLPTENITCEITAMESLSRAVVETYLKRESISKGKFDEDSHIPVPTINQTKASTSSCETSDTSNQTDQAPNPLADLLQNFVLHLFAATHKPLIRSMSKYPK